MCIRDSLSIVGEYNLNIHHALMSLAGQTIEDIQEVHSHPMALLQCKEFFRNHPHIKLIEAADTANVAKHITEEQCIFKHLLREVLGQKITRYFYLFFKKKCHVNGL